MIIKTSEGDKNVASKGLGGAALGLAIPGTVALVNQLAGGNGFLGLGGNPNQFLQAELSKVSSEKYTDSVAFENYKDLMGKIYELDKKVAVNEQADRDSFAFVNARIDSAKREAIAYADATFIKGQMYLPSTSVTPLPMDRYDSWTAPTSTSTNG